MDTQINILIVEDNLFDVRLIQDMLIQAESRPIDPVNFKQFIVNSLKDALQALNDQPIDVVLLDLSLPDSKGLETYRSCYEAAQEIPIIILSGLDDEQVAVQAVREGAQDYMMKNSVDHHLLIRGIRYAIERQLFFREKERLIVQLLQSQKLEAMGQLTDGVAHDFNNLMTVVQGFTDILIQRTEKDHQNYKPLEQIRSASESAEDLTQKMLIFTKRHPYHFVNLNVNTTLEELMKILHRIIGEDIEITTYFDENLWSVSADRSSLEQVIMNLALNARDAMSGGGSMIISTENMGAEAMSRLKKKGARAVDSVKLTVEDTGCGFDSETLSYIFDPYLGATQGSAGTGLGLAVVQGIVDEHKGFIEVESEVGKGARFHVYLPASKEAEPVPEPVPPDVKVLQGDSQSILIVDDAEGVRAFASTALTENNYQVFTASDYAGAMDVIDNSSGKIDLVVSDVVLPDKNGIDLVETLLQKIPDIKVLLCSGYTGPKSQWPVIHEKGYPFMQKPYSFEELLKTVKEVLEE